MIKKLLLVLFCLCFLLNSSVLAQKSESLITPEGDFYTTTENAQKVSEIIGLSESELISYCDEKGIDYIAVNADNSKQIRITSATTDFSESIANISLLSNNQISNLLPSIIGLEGIKGSVIEKNGQKFIKTEMRSNDSGGEYIFTQYITIADKKSFILSFYTAAGSDLEYIEKTFESYNNPVFLNTDSEKNNVLGIVLPIAAVFFAALCIFITVTVIKDLKNKPPKNQENSEQ